LHGGLISIENHSASVAAEEGIGGPASKSESGVAQSIAVAEARSETYGKWERVVLGAKLLPSGRR